MAEVEEGVLTQSNGAASHYQNEAVHTESRGDCSWDFFSLSLSLKCALRESGCRIGYVPTKMSREHFWRSISRDTNVAVSALSPLFLGWDRRKLS